MALSWLAVVEEEESCMVFELWHMHTNNLINTFADEEAALMVVLDAIEQHGEELDSSFALATENAGGNTQIVALGSALVERARAIGGPRRAFA